jgi:uncharacterized circularly permuted ATP-grasp superfamily protein
MNTKILKKYFNEMYSDNGAVRDIYQSYARWLKELPDGTLERRNAEAELLFRRLGITFAVYGETKNAERLIPFDIVPRIFGAAEWQRLEQGLKQRVRALNAFLHDIYHDQEIIKAGVISAHQVLDNKLYRPEMQGVDLPNQVYAHIAGIDLVRVAENDFYVLEDNLRTPSGVSYMLENRKTMMRLFPELFVQHTIEPVEHYPQMLLNTLREAAPANVTYPVIVVMTPGSYNSAYFEHAYLASQMGVELVEGQDLFVHQQKVYMHTTDGPQQVHVIYPAGGRRFYRSTCVPSRFDAWCAGFDGCLLQRQCGTSQRCRHRCSGRQIHLSVRTGNDPLLSRRSAAAIQCADLALK